MELNDLKKYKYDNIVSMFQRFGLGFNYPIIEGLKYIKMTKLINKKINYLKQYETRDFHSKFKINKNVNS